MGARHCGACATLWVTQARDLLQIVQQTLSVAVNIRA